MLFLPNFLSSRIFVCFLEGMRAREFASETKIYVPFRWQKTQILNWPILRPTLRNRPEFRSKVANFTYALIFSFLVNLHDFRNLFLKVSCVATHILQRFDFVLLCWLQMEFLDSIVHYGNRGCGVLNGGIQN